MFFAYPPEKVDLSAQTRETSIPSCFRRGGHSKRPANAVLPTPLRRRVGHAEHYRLTGLSRDLGASYRCLELARLWTRGGSIYRLARFRCCHRKGSINFLLPLQSKRYSK